MGTKWILQLVLLLGAVMESLSAASTTQQSSKVTTVAVPTSSKAPSQSKKSSATRRDGWQPSKRDTPASPQYNRSQPSLSTAAPLPNSTGANRHTITHIAANLRHHQSPHIYPVPAASANHMSKIQGSPLSLETSGDPQQYSTASTFFKISHAPYSLPTSNFPVLINPKSYTPHPSANSEKLTEPSAQSRAITSDFNYESFSQPTRTLGTFIPPTFSPSLEQNLGKFEPFPPFQYSHTNPLFPGLETTPGHANQKPNLDFELGNSNFALTSNNFVPSVYPGNNQQSQVRLSVNPSKFPAFSGTGPNTFYGKGVGKPLEYQPLSAQPQLHFYHPSHPASTGSPTFGGVGGPGDVANELDINQMGREGYRQGAGTTPYIPSNFGNSHPMTSFKNTAHSFEVPTSGIFNDYDKTFGKYAEVDLPTGGGKESVDGQYQHSPSSHGTEEEKGEKDEKSEYQSEEATSASREQYNDEEEGESQHNERRGKNARKREKNETEDKYDKNDGYNFERDFDESYKQELPMEDFEHSEENLDEEEPTKTHKRASSPRARNASRNSQQSRNRKAHSAERCHEFPSFVKNDDSHESSKGDKKAGLPPKTSSFGFKIPRQRHSRLPSHESLLDGSSQKSRDSPHSRKNPSPPSNKNNSSH